MHRLSLAIGLSTFWLALSAAYAEPPTPRIKPLVRVVDLDVGDSRQIELSNGKKVTVELVALNEKVGSPRAAVRWAEVEVKVDGQTARLVSANYRLPITVGEVEIDCPITAGYVKNSGSNAWSLDADARLRLWPKGSPRTVPGSFVYPVRQRWFASDTQMSNEPCYVNACEKPSVRKIYYHYGLDFGGAERLVEVVAATDGLVVSAREEKLEGHDDSPVRKRYDVVYILDPRGWYYRYSHFHSIDESIRPGVTVRAGQRLGLLGKEGGSGGWSHLHFDISSLMPSGRWGCQEAYCMAWEAYQRQYAPKLQAVARPHHVIFAGEEVTLDGSRSLSETDPIVQYDWTLTDGTTGKTPRLKHTYNQPGYFSETLKITDAAGRIDYDFAVVHVLNPKKPEPIPPAIHAVYHPTFDIEPGDLITFKVRTFGTTDGHELWDFGDSTPPVRTQSDGNVKSRAPDGYAITTHRYRTAGHYLVHVIRTDTQGHRAVARLHVRVGNESP